MAIDALNNYNNNLKFGALSNGYKPANLSKYYGVPNTTPEVVSFGLPSSSDMEIADKFANANLGVNSINPYRSNINESPMNGFVLPQNNGTGELQPIVKGGVCGNKLDFCA